MSKINAFTLLMEGTRAAAKAAKNKSTISRSASSIPVSPPSTPSLQLTSPQKEFEHLLQFDGGSRGNPGVSGSGSVIYFRSSELWNRSVYLGDYHTNNYAEYYGLIVGLIGAKELKIRDLKIQGDSNLIINQVTGKFNIKSETLIPLHQRVLKELKHFDNVVFEHIYRNKNKRADELANIAMDKKMNADAHLL